MVDEVNNAELVTIDEKPPEPNLQQLVTLRPIEFSGRIFGDFVTAPDCNNFSRFDDPISYNLSTQSRMSDDAQTGS